MIKASNYTSVLLIFYKYVEKKNTNFTWKLSASTHFIKVLNKPMKAKKEKKETGAILVLPWQRGWLPGQRFWKSHDRTTVRDVSVYFRKDKVFLYPSLKTHIIHLSSESPQINTGQDLRGERMSSTGRWRDGKRLGRGQRGEDKHPGKCKAQTARALYCLI